MEQEVVAIPRLCTWEDVKEIETLSKKVLEKLAEAKKSDFFGGVDKDEIMAAMREPSVVIIAEDDEKHIIGFLLLQEPNTEEEAVYEQQFPEQYRIGKGMIVNGIGVDPDKREGGVATKMLKAAKAYAKMKGFTQFIGTIHPENEASKKVQKKISEKVQMSEPFEHKTRDNRTLLRMYFVQELL